MTDERYQFIIKHLPLVISVIVSTALAVFWVVMYINSPINTINVHLASIDTQLQNVEQAHEAYGKLSATEAQAIIDINLEIKEIVTALRDNGYNIK